MREARNHETVRWQRFEVVHFFDVAVADFTPGFVTLPNEAGITGGFISSTSMQLGTETSLPGTSASTKVTCK